MTTLKPPPMSDAEIDAVLDAAKVGEPPSGFEFLDLSIGRAISNARDQQWSALVAELQRDAERYRWLRDYAVRFIPEEHQMPKSAWCVQGTGHEDSWPCEGEELDAAIDAARGEKGSV